MCVDVLLKKAALEKLKFKDTYSSLWRNVFAQLSAVTWDFVENYTFFLPFWGFSVKPEVTHVFPALLGDEYFVLNHNLHVFASGVAIVFNSQLLFTFCSNSLANIGVLVYVFPSYFMYDTTTNIFSAGINSH